MQRGTLEYGLPSGRDVDVSYAGFLVADENGLIYLRSKIDELLAGEEVVVFDDDLLNTELIGIHSIKSIDDLPEVEPTGFWEIWNPILLLLFLFLTFCCGLWKIAELIF